MQNFEFFHDRNKNIWLVSLKGVWFSVHNSHPQVHRGCSQLFCVLHTQVQHQKKFGGFFPLVCTFYEYFKVNGYGLVP